MPFGNACCLILQRGLVKAQNGSLESIARHAREAESASLGQRPGMAMIPQADPAGLLEAAEHACQARPDLEAAKASRVEVRSNSRLLADRSCAA